jgi:hypothetical protein
VGLKPATPPQPTPTIAVSTSLPPKPVAPQAPVGATETAEDR